MDKHKRFATRAIFFALAAAALVLPLARPATAADLSGTYSWNPVKVGAGGFVTGFVTHPLDATVRYCRTDVGNSYRWDNAANAWKPMIARNADGSGVLAGLAVSPGQAGCEEIAVDPGNVNIVYMSFPITYSADSGNASITNTLYKSTDGGKNFTATSLVVTGGPNGNWRTYSERMKVDPNNSNVIYYGSLQNGLWRSTNAGATWTNVTTGGVPGATTNIINFVFYKGGGTISAFGLTVTKIMYLNVGSGDVYRSADGGQNWTNISTGSGISGSPQKMTVDQNGILWVAPMTTANVWKYNGSWASFATGLNGSVSNVAVDPANASRVFAMGGGGDISRSLDGGATWTRISTQYDFANTLGWLPQAVSGWRSNAGAYFDKNGVIWSPQGNEGILSFTPSADNHETWQNPPLWTISSQGIEEFCGQNVIIPKGLSDKAFICVQDGTGISITDPSTFTAQWVHLQTGILSNSGGNAWCPNASSYIVYNTYDTWGGTGNFSGYSSDGGTTWTRFAASPGTFGGYIAVSRRGAWGLGSDHIIILPDNNGAPIYSKNGGSSWSAAASFPPVNGGYWTFSLKNHQLMADPFTADKFYLKVTSGPLMVTTDGGVNWTTLSNALPNNTHHGNLATNMNVQNDLWFCDGWEGASAHGVWHSTDGGSTWTQNTFFTHAINIALGAGSGVGGDASYTVYCYGTDSTNVYGIWRSTNAGVSWDRVSYYPAGIFDQPAGMAASWDTYGLVYVMFSGNTCAYGKITGATIPPPPTGLTATAGNTQVVLSWNASSGATSYSIYRGTTAGGENATAIASGIGSTSYTNTGLTNGTTYYYKVKATNSFGTSGYSNEASATPAPQPPPAPTGVMALAGDAQVSLTWVAASGATSYNVYRGTTAGGESGTAIATGIAGTSYSNTGLTNNTTYYYYIKAVNASGTGAASAEVSAKPTTANANIALATSAPTIDGTVDAVWAGATSYPMANVVGTIPSGQTNSGSWQALWDSTNLYVLVTMQDSTIVPNNDGIEVYVDGNNGKSATYTLVDWQWLFPNGGAVQEWQNGSQGINTTGIVKAEAAIAGGYRLEAKIPWTTIGVNAFAGDNIGLDIAYNNYKVAATRDNKLFWFSTVDNDWNTPSLFGTAKLMPAASAPPVPTGLAATPGNAQVALTWNASSGATAYDVKRSTVSGSGYVVVSSPATTSYTNTGLTNGTTYYFVVAAKNASGSSANSSQVSGTPVAPPAAPTGLTATPGNAQVALSWTASSGATSYNVKRSTVSGSGYAQVANVGTTSYTNTGLTNGTTYYFVVTALNAGGESGNSNQASATPVASSESPWSGTACGGSAWAVPGTISLANYDCGGEGVAYHDSDTTNVGTYYRTDGVDIDQTPDPGGVAFYVGWSTAGEWVKVTANVASTGLYNIGFRLADGAAATGTFHLEDTNGTNLTGTVTAPVTGGWQTWTTVTVNNVNLTAGAHTFKFVFDTINYNIHWMSFTAAGSPPAAPTGLTATSGEAQAALSWSASTGATSYNVKRSTVSGSGYVTVSSPATTSYTNTGLTDGTTYYYVVSAVNASGESANSTQVSVVPAESQIAAGTATIDGVAEAAWNNATAYSLTKTTGTITNGADCSATWKGMWDATNLYILASITDDLKVNDSTNPWDDDSVEIYLDADHNGGTTYDANDRQIVCGWGDAAAVEGAARSITGVTFGKTDPTGTTYIIETKIPWSVEAFTAAQNKVIGIDVHVNDDDDGGARDGKVIWQDGTDMAWSNPSLFGNGRLN